MTPAAVLRLIAAAFDGLPGIRLEYSVRLRPGHVEISGRFCCWISHSAAAAGAVAGLLRQLGAPDAVAASLGSCNRNWSAPAVAVAAMEYRRRTGRQRNR